MFNKYLFLQKNYEKINPKLAEYGCFFLTLCYLSQLKKNPRIQLSEIEDVLKVAKNFQEKGYLDNDFYVLQAANILKELTGSNFKQLSFKSNFGILGRETYFPVLYPLEEEVYEIICYRNKDNMNSTHFSLGKTSTGDDQEVKILFNTLGEKWLKEKESLWFASDKRAFKELEK